DKPLEEGLFEVMRHVHGAFSLVMMTHDTLIAMRDPNGVRPLCLGELRNEEDGKIGYVVASETCALTVAGADFIREIEPGEILFINNDGLESVHFKEDSGDRDKRPALCIFEFIYLARPDSDLVGQNVHQARRRMGA